MVLELIAELDLQLALLNSAQELDNHFHVQILQLLEVIVIEMDQVIRILNQYRRHCVP